jgi:imidazolonepropionase-like amidohydrolase
MIAIKAGKLFDGTGKEVIEDATVLIEKDRIKEIKGPGQINLSGDMEIVDLSKFFVLPGMIDCHTHLTVIPSKGNQGAQLLVPKEVQILTAASNIRIDLKSGVTTMVIMGEENFIDVVVRNSIRQGVIPGPHLLIATRGIFTTHGRGAVQPITIADSPDEMRKLVRQNLAAGADFTKLYVTGGIREAYYNPFSFEEIKTAVEETHRVGKRATAHAHGGQGLRYCLEAGMDSIIHGACLSDEDIEMFIKLGRWLIGTQTIYLHEEGLEIDFRGNEESRRFLENARIIVREMLTKVIRAGIKYVVGTDSVHGRMSQEIKYLTQCGVSNKEAILTATKKAAEFAGILDKTGTIEPGKTADLIAVSGNPLHEIDNLSKVVFVMKGGKRYDTLSIL